MLTRREMLRASAFAAFASLPGSSAAQGAKGFQLPPLPYPADALEPSIDAETMTIHHDKHHQAYVDNLNKALADHPEWLAKPIEEVVAQYKQLPAAVQTAVRNNGGGHLNHTWFWLMMARPGSGGRPAAELAKAIDQSFGSLDGFYKELIAAGLGQFGSGWAWLVVGKNKPLEVLKTPNQDNPITDGYKVLLGVDVWEHAYYLKYRNLRAKYLEEWLKVINWNFVNELYAKK